MVTLFAVTLFASATLLFLVELMFAKMVLPLLGGTPAVWNTCMVFFQAALLAGYVYAHLSTSYLRPSRQIPVHLALVALALISLPVAIAPGWSPPRAADPTLWLLGLLTVSVGLPFFVISTTSPVLQRWFSRTRHPAAGDPYFLYVASNFGSVVGLLGYLAVLEPHSTLAEQGHICTIGYAGLMALIGGCALCSLVYARPAAGMSESQDDGADQCPVSIARRVRWVALAFAPSSLMLGVTTFLTTDIASAPLLWVVPLTLYLLTFMLAFARRRLVPLSWFLRALPFLVLVQMVVLAWYAPPMPWAPALHLITFFVVAAACHCELADDRPPPRHLTEFYLLLSAGGVLGGVFNALIAPVVFNSVIEYPLILVFACVLCLKPGTRLRGRARLEWTDLAWPLALGASTAAVLMAVRAYDLDSISWMPAAVLGVVAVVCYAMVERPVRFGVGLGLTVLAVGLVGNAGEQTLVQQRTFFGVLRVRADPARDIHSLISGTTLHGMQCTTPSKRRDALTYYGPAGIALRGSGDQMHPRNVAVIGLGVATLASYAERGQSYVFYEIDPAVAEIAANPTYFTFLRDARARGASARVIFGDGRLTIADAKPKSYDVIVLDAFSSDSIPVHLLTRQALRLYLSKLDDHGLLMFHISNRHLDLKPVVGALAADSGLVCYILDRKSLTRSESERGVALSTWALLARRKTDLSGIALGPQWKRARSRAGFAAWTDDYSNILGVMKWHR